ncbi:MAG: hypothetical protein A2W25_00370 [candidate division Zixibacteria bacterium RBG_16_53_22]|nr:MAG: hypothetical protein A2W25_00370 [candidate division Zixibacteria bacterium RBG_16_53_22]
MFKALTAGRGKCARWIILSALLIMIIGLYSGCGKDREIIRYLPEPGSVSLAYPPADTFITVNTPTFIWHRLTDGVRYQLQVAYASDFINKSFDIQTADTFYAVASILPNGTHFWRVRAQNEEGVWGDWSDAEIRALYKSDYVNYFELVSMTDTYGIPQDVFVRNDTAFVADGQAGLTMFDVSDPANPMVLENIDSIESDFAKSIYINPQDTFPYVMVADMDGRVYAINLPDTTRTNDLRLTSTQNCEDVTGFFKNDTLWIAAVASSSQRKLSIIQVLYNPFMVENPGLVPEFELSADGLGVRVDSSASYVFVACGVAGLRIYDITNVYNSALASTVLLSSTAMAVDVKDGYAYVACDHAGLFVVDVRDARNPSSVVNVNTSGRTKDVQVLGGYAFIADANGGLKAIDTSIPDSAHFVAAYATPYAYGLYATLDYIYVCDRDNGLMVFENRTSQ